MRAFYFTALGMQICANFQCRRGGLARSGALDVASLHREMEYLAGGCPAAATSVPGFGSCFTASHATAATAPVHPQ